MAQYSFNFVELKSNFYSDVNKKCISCNVTSGDFVRLGNCVHSTVITDFFLVEKTISDELLCGQCHNFLKKVDKFMKSVQVNLQSEQVPTSDIKFYLSRTDIEVISFSDNDSICPEQDVKRDTDNDSNNSNDKDSNFEIDQSINQFSTNENTDAANDIEFTVTDIKVEQDSSDFETDVSLFEIQKAKKAGTNTEDSSNDMRIPELDGKHKSVPKKKGKTKVKKPISVYKGIFMLTLSDAELSAERERARMKPAYLKLPYKCEHCLVAFDHEINLQNHRDRQHTPKPGALTCDICKSVLKNESSFKEHTKRHYRRYMCEQCGKTNATLGCIVTHYNEAHGGDVGEDYECDLCQYKTRSERQYRYHKDKHKEKLKCVKCTKEFINNATLKKHLLTTHKLSPRTYACEQCDKVYSLKTGLLAHMSARHAGGARCEPCSLSFRSAGTLRQHLRNHSAHVAKEDWKFVCDECGQRFLRKPALQEHIDYHHLHNRQHKCDQCGKSFMNKTKLKKHRLFVHEKQRPPRDKICHHCGRAFYSHQLLEAHIRTHTGERPLKCARCPADFAHKAALYNHTRLLHADK